MNSEKKWKRGRKKKLNPYKRFMCFRLTEDEFALIKDVVRRRRYRYKNISEFARRMCVVGGTAELGQLAKEEGVT